LNAQNIQFIWAVFSAVPVGFRRRIKNIPFVNISPFYWNGSAINPQLKGANFEVACWDSSATILVGLIENLAKNFLNSFPDAVELKFVSR